MKQQNPFSDVDVNNLEAKHAMATRNRRTDGQRQKRIKRQLESWEGGELNMKGKGERKEKKRERERDIERDGNTRKRAI